jgi:tetratricopeptide (TPR) repeat protein
MFGHALIRDGAYASLLHTARRALHLRAADWYAERDATLHAEHLDRAGDPRAADAYLRAAQSEAAALRVESALRLLRRGSELDAPNPIRHALAALEGKLCHDIGEPPGAIRAFERALPLAADDAQRCAAWIGIAAGHRLTSTMEPAFAALDHAEELAVRGGLDRELSRIHYLRGNLHFAQGNGEACQTEHERALAFAQRAGDAECEAQALSGLGDAHYAHGRMRSAHAAFSRCVAICESEGLARFAIMNNAMIAMIETWLGNSDAALQRLARTHAVARELRHRAAEAMSAESIGWTLVLHGRFEEAETHLQHGFELAREMGARRYEMMCLMSLAHVCWRRAQAEARVFARSMEAVGADRTPLLGSRGARRDGADGHWGGRAPRRAGQRRRAAP